MLLLINYAKGSFFACSLDHNRIIFLKWLKIFNDASGSLLTHNTISRMENKYKVRQRHPINIDIGKYWIYELNERNLQSLYEVIIEDLQSPIFIITHEKK